MTHTLGMHIFEAHAPADIVKHTNNIPPHGMIQWANAHLTIGRLRSDPIGREQEKDESKTSRIGIKCVAKSTLLLLFAFCFWWFISLLLLLCIYIYVSYKTNPGYVVRFENTLPWCIYRSIWTVPRITCSCTPASYPKIYECNEKTATTMKNKIKQIICTHIYHWQADAQTYRKKEIPKSKYKS